MKFLIAMGMALTVHFASAQASDLINMLTNEMGITQQQAEGGAGSIFKFAQETMGQSDFADLSKVIPNMDGLLGAVPKLGGSGMLGGLTSQLTGMPAVIGAFEKLGLNESHIQLMTPLLNNYIEKKGGELLSKAFMSSIGL